MDLGCVHEPQIGDTATERILEPQVEDAVIGLIPTQAGEVTLSIWLESSRAFCLRCVTLLGAAELSALP